MDKKAIDSYALLDQYCEHDNALVHASGQATVDDDSNDADKWSGPGYQQSDSKDMIIWTPQDAYHLKHLAYDPTMPHVEFVWPTPEGRAQQLASIFTTWSSFNHVGNVPKGVRRITTCKIETKPNGDATIGDIAKG